MNVKKKKKKERKERKKQIEYMKVIRLESNLELLCHMMEVE
jgi:hypothetical protein